MKIVSIHFKNIASLQGVWEIRFDRPPLSDTGLFAIVGPNGSGKTSVLDAITLALYGETPRMKDPEKSLINKDSSDSFSEVTFSVGGQLYRSRWSVRKNGQAPESPEMKIVSLNGRETLLEDRVVMVRTRVAELTGLDFKRFCRSILLAQGEFSAFLNALENERSEMLGKIIGPELAQELEQSVHTRSRAEHERLLQLQEAAEELPSADKDRLNTLTASLEETEGELQQVDGFLGELKRTLELRRRMDHLEAKAEAAREALASAEARAAEAQKDIYGLEEAAKAAPLREDTERLNALQLEAETARDALSSLEAEMELHRGRLAELEAQLLQSRQRLEEAQAQRSARSADVQKAQQLDQDIAAESARFLEEVSRYEAYQRILQEKLQQQSDVEKQFNEVGSHQREMQQWLVDHSLDAGLEAELPGIEDAWERLQEIRRQLSEEKIHQAAALKAEQQAAADLKRDEDALQKALVQLEESRARKDKREERTTRLLGTDTLESILAKREELKERLAACGQLLKIGQEYHAFTTGGDPLGTLAQMASQEESLAHSLSLEEAQLAKWEERARWLEALARYAPDRSILKTGAPCPLCGALDHPYVEQGPPDFDAEERALQEQQDRVDALRTRLSELRAEKESLQPKAGRMEALQKSWLDLCARVGGEWSITDPDAVKEDLLSVQRELKRLKSLIRTLRWRKWGSAWSERKLQRLNEKVSRRERERDRLRDAHALQVQALTDLENTLRQLQGSEAAAREELGGRILPFDHALPTQGMEAELIQRLKQRAATYRRQLREQEALAGRMETLEARRSNLPPEISQLREETEGLGSAVETLQQRIAALKAEHNALFQGENPVQEDKELESRMTLATEEQAALSAEIHRLRRALSEHEQTWPQSVEKEESAQAALQQAEQDILQKAVPLDFKSLEDLKRTVALLEAEAAVTERWKAAEQTLEQARSQCEAVEAELASIRSQDLGTKLPEALQSQIEAAEKQRELLQEELDAANRSLRELREADRMRRDALDAVAVQEKIYAHTVAEEKALASRDPVAVKTKLQRLMFERLLDRTNQHLESLNGRYHLRALSEEGLGLHVEDALHGGTCRATKTLSGGESFQVSLCLALGLADMAGKDRKIESLFLDEGFGALDDEMLYKVMAALKGLRANGKTVGVISHVKRLADEIPTQIRLEKQRGGRSTLSIVA
ncbi:AAA family ATPase [Desulforhabdus sp. TSK]|uniref:AAA family ATPase n=1 Tax=Desulforhabdus sp. TSK TaxID=2925014 RepID=UPI001FC86874|nr:AAA family ATPase [Desulforhabdus sp. TSK]GKT08051.1 nuclease SbcCD subunit C [Desulforhabdus sp. TSK]